MLGAFRRYGAVQASRCVSRAFAVRSTPQRLQWQPRTVSALSPSSKSWYHSSPICFSVSNNAPAQQDTPEVDQEQLPPPTKFDELATRGLVDPTVVDTLKKKMRLETMTEVQSLTIAETLKGDDVLAQAKTGTGKTLAFLIPVLQNILSDPTLKNKMVYDRYFQRGSRRDYDKPRASAADIRAIIISPTRELAEQIAVEARRLSFGTGVVVQTAVGGTQKRSGLQSIQREGCHMLIATPGRLKDILSDPYSGVSAPNLSFLVLDEADRLLDAGFAPELMEVQSLLPDPTKVNRQTLMFSATVPREVMSMVRRTMKPGFRFIKTVREDETPTHLSVPQKAVVLSGLENTYPALLELVKNYISDPSKERPFKGIVYFNSTKEVNLAYEVFDRLLNDPKDPRSGHPFGRMIIGEIHARLSQAQRTRISNAFRNCQTGILFSSDVTARGLDFPNVSHIFQIGIPRDRETYIHRLGRTARANKTGEGWVFLHHAEWPELRRRLGKDIPIQADDGSLALPTVNMSKADDGGNVSPEMQTTLEQIKSAVNEVPPINRADAYKTLLANLCGVFPNKHALGRAMRDLAIYGYGLREAPRISPLWARKFNLQRADGINVGDEYSSREFSSRGSSSRSSHASSTDYSGSRRIGRFNRGTGGFEEQGNGQWSRENELYDRRGYREGRSHRRNRFRDD